MDSVLPFEHESIATTQSKVHSDPGGVFIIRKKNVPYLHSNGSITLQLLCHASAAFMSYLLRTVVITFKASVKTYSQRRNIFYK